MDILRAFLTTKGRLPRLGYAWRGFLALFVSVCGLYALGVTSKRMEWDGTSVAAPLASCFILAFAALGLWAQLALTMRRLHDMDLAGIHAIWIFAGGWLIDWIVGTWPEWSPLAALPFAATAFILFRRGTRGPNRYGEDPVPRPAHATA